jgi:hypothetical protein
MNKGLRIFIISLITITSCIGQTKSKLDGTWTLDKGVIGQKAEHLSWPNLGDTLSFNGKEFKQVTRHFTRDQGDFIEIEKGTFQIVDKKLILKNRESNIDSVKSLPDKEDIIKIRKNRIVIGRQITINFDGNRKEQTVWFYYKKLD